MTKLITNTTPNTSIRLASGSSTTANAATSTSCCCRLLRLGLLRNKKWRWLLFIFILLNYFIFYLILLSLSLQQQQSTPSTTTTAESSSFIANHLEQWMILPSSLTTSTTTTRIPSNTTSSSCSCQQKEDKDDEEEEHDSPMSKHQQHQQLEVVPSLTLKQRQDNIQLLWTGSGRRYYQKSQQSQQQQLQEPFQSIRLVISHCLHNLDWLSNFTQGYNSIDIGGNNNNNNTLLLLPSIIEITIISKCGKPIEGIPTSMLKLLNVIRLPNVGKWDHSYTYYLSQYTQQQQQEERNNNNKNEAILFLKDDYDIQQQQQQPTVEEEQQEQEEGIYRTLTKMLWIASQTGFACGTCMNKFSRFGMSLSAFHQTNDLYQFKPINYNRHQQRQPDNIVPFQSEYKDLGTWFKSILLLPTLSTSISSTNMTKTTKMTTVQLPLLLPVPLTQVCYGGIFVTTRTNILKATTTLTIQQQQQQQQIQESNTLPTTTKNNFKKKNTKVIPLSLWNIFQLSLQRGDNIEEIHYMERIWAGLLSTSISDREMIELVKYKTKIMNLQGSIMGSLSILNKDHETRKKQLLSFS